jgi:hypothetical protein
LVLAVCVAAVGLVLAWRGDVAAGRVTLLVAIVAGGLAWGMMLK